MSSTSQSPPSITLPNQLAFIGLALQFVKWNAHQLGFDEKKIHDIELATEETINNVIQNAFLPGENGSFSIISIPTLSGLKIIIKDQGIPFDPKKIPVYNPGKQSFNTPKPGLEWYLIHQFMDEVSFRNLGREGKEIHLTKFAVHPSNITQKNSSEEATVPPKKTVIPFPKNSVPFRARRAIPTDAIEIAKCAYDAYAYTYIYEQVYYPDRFGAMLKNGDIISAIAETKGKEPVIMAHNALVIDDPKEKIAEMGMTFTKSEYQNQGCGKKTGLLLIKEAIKKGLKGLWGTAVTTHIYSQKGIVSAGVKECAILLGYFPDNWKWKHFEQQNQRITAVLGFYNVPLTSMLSFKRPTLYLPEQHASMLANIYTNLNDKPRFTSPKEAEKVLPEQPTSFVIYDKKYEKKVKIEIEAYGPDVIEMIQATLQQLVIQKVELIYLHLNLRDPLTAVMTKEFEALGFFFAGIFPRPVSGDQLILQYLNNILIDYENIHIYSEFAQSLLAYIKDRDPIYNSLKK